MNLAIMSDVMRAARAMEGKVSLMSPMEYINALQEKGFIGGGMDEVVKVLPRGYEFLQQKSNTYRGVSIYNNTINSGANSNNNIMSTDVQQSISQEINTKFDKAIDSIVELIKSSNLDDEDKEFARSQGDELKRLEAKNSEHKLDRMKLLVSSLELLLKTGDLLTRAAPALLVLHHHTSS